MSIKYGSSLLAGMPDVEKLLDSTSFTGTPTVPTATVGDNSKQIANTEFVQNAISNFSTSGAYKVGTRNWTYEQWKQYASTNVSTSYNPNFDIEGIKVGDIGYVYGTVSDRDNIQALMVGIVTNTDNYPTSINIQSLGLSIQNMDLIDSIMSNYAETSYVDTKLSLKQDSFDIGDNLKWTYKSKNLFNMKEFLNYGGTLQEDGSYLLPARYLMWLPFDVVKEDAPGKSYTLSYKVSLAPENTVDSFNLNSFIIDDAWENFNNPPSQVPVVTKDSFVTVTNTITYPDEEGFTVHPCISTYPYNVSDGTIILIIKDFQVEEGSVATDYVPYVQNTTLHAIVPTETTVDNTSISYNDDNNLQVNGVVERNKGIVNYDWVGTLSEYQEQDIENQHPEWICYITDDYDTPIVPIDSYTKEETDELLDEKANVTDVYTKTETDELLNTVSNDSEKTNCITEIPQDIKLELVDGTLTLKTGSKVYDANGNIININNDLSIGNYGSASTQLGICVNSSGTELVAEIWSYSVSGTTAPTSGFIYNTDTNVISRYSDSTETHTNLSFPICTVSRSSGTLTSIDQVFNGFGYIGSTVFALPGVKGLIPNGRNEDGSLKNTEFVTGQVITHTRPDTLSGSYPIMLDASYMYPLDASYNDHDNLNIRISTNSVVLMVDCGIGVYSSGVITSFTPKTTFHTLDYNNKETIVGWGMPDYSAGVSKTGTWTADYAGVYVIRFGAVEAGSVGHFTINGTTFYSRTYNLEEQQTITAPVGKGDVVVLHSANISAIFYPLKGAK